MLNSILLVAAMLLHGPVMSTSNLPVEQTIISAPAIFMEESIGYDLEKILLEDYAAPYWNLSYDKAWEYYEIRRIRIEEIVPNIHYKIHFDGGLLDVVLEGAGI